MTYEALTKRIKSVPEEYLDEIDDFIGYMMTNRESKHQSAIGLRQFGRERGKFKYPYDFDEDNEKIAELFGVV